MGSSGTLTFFFEKTYFFIMSQSSQENKTEVNNDALTIEQIAKMTFAMLKKELKVRELETKGKKAVLVSRLKESLPDFEPTKDLLQQTKKTNASKKRKATKKESQKKEPIKKKSKKRKATKKESKKKKSKVAKPSKKKNENDEKDKAPKLLEKTFAQRDKQFKTVLNMPSWKLVSWNVNGFRAVLKKGFADYVKEEKADIICLSEVKCSLSDIDTDFSELGYDYVYWNPSTEKKGYAGTAVLSKHKPLNYTCNDISVRKTEGRIITLEFESFFLIHTYVPNSGEGLKFQSDRKLWDLEFRKKLHALEANKPVIWTGDLNVAHLSYDVYDGMTNKNRSKHPGFATYEREAFDTLIKTDGFIDVYRHFYQNEKDHHYTFWSYRGGNRPKNRGWNIKGSK